MVAWWLCITNKTLFLQIIILSLEETELIYHPAVYWHVCFHIFRCHFHTFDAVSMDMGRWVYRQRRRVFGDVQAVVLHLGHLCPHGAPFGNSAFLTDVLRQLGRILRVGRHESQRHLHLESDASAAVFLIDDEHTGLFLFQQRYARGQPEDAVDTLRREP